MVSAFPPSSGDPSSDFSGCSDAVLFVSRSGELEEVEDVSELDTGECAMDIICRVEEGGGGLLIMMSV